MILVTGASGQLGTAYEKRLGDRARYIDIPDLDLTDAPAVRKMFGDLNPETVINCAAYTAVDRAEADEAAAYAVNATAVETMAAASADIGARFVTYSTDYVFDGTKTEAYVESDPTMPINAYGRSKLSGEKAALAAVDGALVIRTSWLMSGTHRSFASVMLDLIAKDDVKVVADQRGRATFVDDLVLGSLEALDAGATGVLHMANAGPTTWYEIARTIAEIAGYDQKRVMPCTTADYPTPAARPANSVLDSERLGGFGLHPLRDFHAALEEAVSELQSA